MSIVCYSSAISNISIMLLIKREIQLLKKVLIYSSTDIKKNPPVELGFDSPLLALSALYVNCFRTLYHKYPR